MRPAINLIDLSSTTVVCNRFQIPGRVKKGAIRRLSEETDTYETGRDQR